MEANFGTLNESLLEHAEVLAVGRREYEHDAVADRGRLALVLVLDHERDVRKYRWSTEYEGRDDLV